ncbi:TRAP transporter small permease [Granulosicoccus antarcticus]|uniref:TRAP transporter small permease protein n=1 Tax=Granulosicoccus antarcticus IMCC3135 TaxID=1192854 RepID=A0A2Z2NZ87_9GAMM|nr:TRAP transporter small permease [Granulosicoccus antarcticus]ASJ74190.1 hypothetical protein IMCC3135_20565 [Granulosicoccus antarcticus IMCC3135]
MIEKFAKNALEFVSGALLVSLMLVTGVDVIGRYLLNKPLTGAFELTEMLLGALVFASLPLVSRAGAHVDVDMLTGCLPAGVQRALAVLIGLLSAAVLLFFALRLWVLGNKQFIDGAHSESLNVPFAAFAWFGALSCVLAAIFGLIEAYRR